MKGQIWISVIIYTLVAVVALVLILSTGIPILNEMRDRAVVTKVQDVMLDLDRHITEIASQGEGSQATVSFEIRDGDLRFEENQIIWELETESEIISPHTSTRQGNLIISSNANVRTQELADSYVMSTSIENDTFKVIIDKIGNNNNWQSYDTTQIVEDVMFNGESMPGTFHFSLNNNASSMSGNGYTEMIPRGNNTNLGRASVVAHMNSSFATYDLEFTLRSYADFVTVQVKNIRPK